MAASNQTGARALTLELGGRTLTVRSDAPQERVDALVAFVNQRLQRIKAQPTAVSSDQVALLTALNIAEELFATRERHERLKARVEDRGKQLLELFDRMAEASTAPPATAEGDRP